MLTNVVFEGLMNAFLQNESFFKREFDDGNILSQDPLLIYHQIFVGLK